MSLLIEFNTQLLDSSGEPKNPINDVRGYTLAKYFSDHLAGLDLACTPVEPEDWGWFVNVMPSNRKYLLGFIEHEGSVADPKFMIQLHKSRTLTEKLRGKEKLTKEDIFASVVTTIIETDLEATDVHIRWAT